MDTNYQVNSNYQGPRDIRVPVRMYSRNSLLGALHIKSKRWLGVNIDRHVLTFHKDKNSTDAQQEIPLSKLQEVRTDVSKANSHKYYMCVKTTEGDLKFKFKNAADFYTAVDALSSVTAGTKQVYQPTEEYKKMSQNFYETRGKVSNIQTRSRSTSSVSSDSDNEYKEEEEKDKARRRTAEEKEKKAKEIREKEEKRAKEAKEDREKGEKLLTEAEKIKRKAEEEAREIREKAAEKVHCAEEKARKELERAHEQAERKEEHARQLAQDAREDARFKEEEARRRAEEAHKKALEAKELVAGRVDKVADGFSTDINKAAHNAEKHASDITAHTQTNIHAGTTHTEVKHETKNH